MKGYVRHSAGRMFDNPVLEWGSKIHPATPFVVYGPLVLGLLAWGFTRGPLHVASSALLFAVGYVAWQLMEYGLHRGFFHWEGTGPFTRRVHAVIHGYHHTYPDDGQRLVMPLGASVPLALVIGGGLYLLRAPHLTLPFFCGLVTGYMAYDFIHYRVHHGGLPGAWGKELRARHMAHHFNTPDKNFGISHMYLDVLFGTLRQRPQRDAGAQPPRQPDADGHGHPTA
ncbi:fatty acid hydroxylase [Aggregicoccus sp. 17bor-14]|uniref:sterol desaturase family protein n=1 Tax=Myxococcaceae TaxID=31 RepID=UPI00129CE845|nr:MULTISPECIES: sterol desaturase family protein [Myxococcaceae]MBF5046293.1 sterol desaturase family protein [Simulacricoccus sp. 17bor-14]MRI92015.1 fatty acid hydroxylase [Aggregicoccus sp. 17bor-14]